MAEPATSTATGVAVATGAVTITGSVLGLGYDVMIGGLIGSLMLVLHLPAAPLKRTVAMVTLGALLSAGFAPIAMAAAWEYFAWARKIPDIALSMACAIALGVVIPAVIPLALLYGKRKSEGGSEK